MCAYTRSQLYYFAQVGDNNIVYFRKAELLDLFKTMDRDNTGKISAEELQTALQPFQMSKQQIKDMVTLHDVDHDGYIEFNEFVQFWK